MVCREFYDYNHISMTVQSDVYPYEKTFLESSLHYLAVLLKYKALIISITTVAAIAVLAFSVVSLKLPPDQSPLPNKYRAYAIVLFQEGMSNVGVSSMLSAFGVDTGGQGNSVSQLAIEILKSRKFTDAIAEKFDIITKYELVTSPVTSSRNIILEESQYNFNRETGSLTISFTHIDPVFAADLVNYEVELLENWFMNQDISLRSRELTLMEEKLNELSEGITSTEQNIENFQKRYGVLDILELASAQTAMLTELRSSLIKVELDIKDYNEISTIEDPALTLLKSRRDNIIDQIDQIESGYVSSDGRRMPSIEELPQLSLTYMHMVADLELKSQLYQSLSERYEVTKLAVAEEEGAFSILEYAEIPEDKIGPSRGRLCIMVTFAAFLFSVALAYIIHLTRRILADPSKRRILNLEDEQPL